LALIADADRGPLRRTAPADRSR